MSSDSRSGSGGNKLLPHRSVRWPTRQLDYLVVDAHHANSLCMSADLMLTYTQAATCCCAGNHLLHAEWKPLLLLLRFASGLRCALDTTFSPVDEMQKLEKFLAKLSNWDVQAE